MIWVRRVAELQAEVAAEKARADTLEVAIRDFREFLMTSPKFGNRPILDSDGLPVPPATYAARLDWIATGDVVARLMAILAEGQAAANGTGG